MPSRVSATCLNTVGYLQQARRRYQTLYAIFSEGWEQLTSDRPPSKAEPIATDGYLSPIRGNHPKRCKTYSLSKRLQPERADLEYMFSVYL